MSRITIPSDFTAQQTLFNGVKAKNDADGKDSPLIIYLNQQGIDLDADQKAAIEAKVHDGRRQVLNSMAQNSTEQRDNAFAPPFTHLKMEVQFLKSLYKGNTKELGMWGITIVDNGRIIYPSGFAAKAALFDNFMVKHNSFTNGSSPLQAFINQQQIDVAADAAAVARARTSDADATANAKGAVNETEQRDLFWQPVLAHLRGIAGFLKTLYIGNPRMLGFWGFNVDDSPQKPKLRTTTVKPGEEKEIKNVLAGSALTNTGSNEVHIYKKGEKNKDFIVVKPGEAAPMLKGLNHIVVYNPSLVETARVSTYKH